MKKFMIAILLGTMITFIVSNHFKTVETALAKSVVRLHIIANSDSDFDQELKLKVRDAIIKNSKDVFSDASDIAVAKLNITKNLDEIKKIAENEIEKNGYDYDVNVTFGKSEFPTKIYNNITLPAGTYEALKVEIGNAVGKNWWCVMFPPLCFVDGSTQKMDSKSKNLLKNSLTDEEYNLVATDKEPFVKVEFKIYELWQEGKTKAKSIVKNFEK